MSNYNETIQNEEYLDDNELMNEMDAIEGTEEDDIEQFEGESTEVTYDDIMDQCTGVDELGNPKAGFCVELGTFDSKTQETKMNSAVTYYNPVLNITRTGEVMMFDFIYKTKVDSELRAFWALLNKYGRDFERAMKEDSHILPLIRIQIVPNYFAGRFSMVCVTPMYWVLQPEIPTGDINMIRMVLSIDSVGFVESEGYNENEILAELEREEMQRQFIEQEMERKREEREAWQEERNARMEELRRNRQD